MTVAEVIEYLTKLPQHLPVIVPVRDGFHTELHPVEFIGTGNRFGLGNFAAIELE